MSKPPPPETRTRLTEALYTALEGNPNVVAVWEAGAVAYGQVDPWSEIELIVVVASREAVAEAAALVRQTVAAEVPVDCDLPLCGGLISTAAFEDPECPRTLLRLDDFGPYLLVDCEVVARDDARRLHDLVRTRRLASWFDREGLQSTFQPQEQPLRESLVRLVEHLRRRHEMLATLPQREVRRGNGVDALELYRSLLLMPLVTLYRIRFCPYRYDCGLRHLRDDLPLEAFRFVKDMVFVHNLEDLKRKIDRTRHELERQLAEIRPEHLKLLPECP